MAPRVSQAIARRVAGKAIAGTMGGWLDLGLGFALLRDRRIGMRHKAMAMAAGAVVTSALVALEVPLEGIVALVLPLLGGMVDLAADGAEETIGTILIGALLLPFIASREVVAEIRAERLGG